MTTRILLISDEKETTSLLGNALNRYGFEVITADSSAEGNQLVREHDPQVVLLRLLMLELDGWQVCTKMRMVSQVPIIIFSAFCEPDTITGVLEAGLDFFLVKPIPIKTLNKYIKNTVDHAEQYAGNI